MKVEPFECGSSSNMLLEGNVDWRLFVTVARLNGAFVHFNQFDDIGGISIVEYLVGARMVVISMKFRAN